MTDQEIKNMLSSYVDQKMTMICEENLPGYDHEYSSKYQKKLNRLLWSEKYFGKKVHLGYMVRRIAMIAVIILSLFLANEVSARTFGFNPWKYLTSFLSDSNMNLREYIGRSDDFSEKIRVVQRNHPKEIPDDMEETSFEQGNKSIYGEWRNGKRSLQYIRADISEEMSIAVDGEYQTKESVEICGFTGHYYVKDNETWLSWDDTQYNHMIIATDINKAKNILKQMAESLYTKQ